MQIHDVHVGLPRRKRRHRVGRGPASGKGKTAGRGSNGFKSRSGNSVPDYYEGGSMPLYRRVPKRGFGNGPFRKRFVTINVEQLNKFDADSNVGPEELLKGRIVRKLSLDGLKILGDGELTVKLTVRAHQFSGAARQKIEAAGGSVELIEKRPGKTKRKAKSS